MSEFRNYIVLNNCTPEKAAEAARSHLIRQRKWKEVPPQTPGAKFFDVWSCQPTLTVVRVVSEIVADEELGKALSLDCGVVAAVHSYESVSSTRHLSVFDHGKEIAVAKSPFAHIARRDSWGDLEPEGPIQTLSFRDSESKRIEEVMDLVREFFEPLLDELSMKPTKILANYPQINAAIGYALSVDDGTRIVVRYTFDRGGPLIIEQDIWRERPLQDNYEWIHGTDRTQWVRDCSAALLPALLKRECQLLAARFVRQGASKIEDVIPSTRSAIEVARRTAVWQRAGAALEELERRRNVARDREPWVAATVVYKGARVMIVETEGEGRFTFVFDTNGLPDAREAAVGALWDSWAGPVAARKLRIGDVTLEFDYEGKYLGRSGG